MQRQVVLLHWLFPRQLRGDRRFRRPYFSVQDGELQCLGIKQAKGPKKFIL